MPRKVLLSLVLFVLLIIAAFSADTPYKAESLYEITEPYTFSIAYWETRNLSEKWVYHVRELCRGDELSNEEEVRTVEGYPHSGQAEATLRPQVQAIIERQLSQVLAEEGLSSRFGFLFPPVDFKMDELPYILVISPRYKIELKETVLLRQNLTPQEIAGIEERVEGLGVSALIEQVGGIATYPSMVPLKSSLNDLLSTVAHEWMHQYLFFHPLGRHYWANYDMRTINETVADMAGDELSSLILHQYYGIEVEKGESEEQKPAFDFNKEMREIRLTVDQYLEEGKIEEAEAFMRQKQDFLQSKGYYIRRLNQAYFAWHGTYADSPTSISPIGGELKELRNYYPSLGEFIKAVSQISSYDELKKLLKAEASCPQLTPTHKAIFP